jgi:probable HAF family extracellular repeat protein
MRRIFGTISLALTVMAILEVGLSRPIGAANLYTVTDLGTLPDRSSSIAYGIRNGVGPLEVVGSAATYPENESAFIYSGGSIQMLPALPGGEINQARGINSAGDVVGSSSIDLDKGPFHAFRYRRGVLEDLGTLPGGRSSFGNAINNAGDVAGGASTADGAMHAILYSGGRVQDLSTLGGEHSFATGINDASHVVGQAQTASGDRHAFRYRGGTMEDLGTLGGTESFARRINNNGVVVGYADDPQERRRAFLQQVGRPLDLGTLGGTGSEGYGLNHRGQVVGVSQTATGANHAFLYTEGVLLDLNDLIAADSGWVLAIAYDISDDGRIVGAGIHNGQRRAFLLTPQ